MEHRFVDFENVLVIYKDYLYMDTIISYNHNSNYSLILPRENETVKMDDVDYIVKGVHYNLLSEMDGSRAFIIKNITVYLEKQ